MNGGKPRFSEFNDILQNYILIKEKFYILSQL